MKTDTKTPHYVKDVFDAYVNFKLNDLNILNALIHCYNLGAVSAVKDSTIAKEAFDYFEEDT